MKMRVMLDLCLYLLLHCLFTIVALVASIIVTRGTCRCVSKYCQNQQFN